MRAEEITHENIWDFGASQIWTAKHVDCGGVLRIIDDDWKCDECGENFHDDHCADIVHEREDRAAREAASKTWKEDPEGSARRLTEARVGIWERLLEKRAARAEALGGHGDHELAFTKEREAARQRA